VNPFKAWLIVVAISGVPRQLLLEMRQKERRREAGALLGGAYSSTFTTFGWPGVPEKRNRRIAIPERSCRVGRNDFRFLALIAFFNMELMRRLLFPFLILGVIGVAGGWAWVQSAGRWWKGGGDRISIEKPAELTSAFRWRCVCRDAVG